MTDFVIKRVETIGPVRLYLGDCLEIMPTLELSDLCVTDPPYLLTSGGNAEQSMGGLFAQSNYDKSYCQIWCLSVLGHAAIWSF